MTTKKCGKCKQTLPLTEFNKKSSNKDGHSGTCKLCTSDLRRLQREKREADETDEEFRARREKTLAAKRKYREQNREKLAVARRRSKLKAELPKLVQEMRVLRAALDACDDPDARQARLSQAWMDWAKHLTEVLLAQQGVPTRPVCPPEADPYTNPTAYDRWMEAEHSPYSRKRAAAVVALHDHPMYRHICAVQKVFDVRGGYQGGYRLKEQYEALVAKFDGIDSADLHSALTHVPQQRDIVLAPSDRRWFERNTRRWEQRQQELTETEKSAREVALHDLLYSDELNDDAQRAITSRVAGAVSRARKRGAGRVGINTAANQAYHDAMREAEADAEMETFGAMGRDLERRQEEADERARKEREAKDRRNARRREQRAEAKAEAERLERRREQKRNSARRRRAEGRKT